MKIIVNASTLVSNILNKQKINDENYRPLKHLMYHDVDDGKLIYNCLTGELILLEENENFFDDKLKKTLIEKWFLVPQNNDDCLLCDNTNNIGIMLSDAVKHPPITKYTIFTTTDCNARCFYCFEKGTKKVHMTEDTALDVAKFILKSCKGNPVKLTWFGGEPLYNLKVIDIICDFLAKNNIKFSSKIVSNGYLFDEETVQKAVSRWNTNKVQIAMDGTEEVYNRYKAYIYDDGSAFVKVMDNIERLLKTGVNVVIRLNMDDHNADDLYLLTEQLFDKFGEYNNLSISLHLLLENSTKKQINRTDEERHLLKEKHSRLNKFIEEKIGVKKYSLVEGRRFKQCKADNNAATTILPDGRLGKCDYYTDEGIWGSIYSSEINEEEIKKFKKFIRPNGGEKCNTCPARPVCFQLELCSDRVTRCDAVDQARKIKHMDKCILDTYDDFKKTNI